MHRPSLFFSPSLSRILQSSFSSSKVNFENDLWVPHDPARGIQEATLKKYTKEVFDKAKQVGDQVADEAVAALVKNNEQKYYREFMKLQISNKEELPSSFPTALKDYVNSHKIPTWADRKKMVDGAHLFSRFTFPINSILSWSSLPVLFCFPEGVEVLGRTGELTTSNFGPRILNTVRFVTAVSDPKGFEPDGRAIKTIAKVRLTHAFVRYSLLNQKQAKHLFFKVSHFDKGVGHQQVRNPHQSKRRSRDVEQFLLLGH